VPEGWLWQLALKKGLGTVATTLIQKGTLKVGDNFVAGASYPIWPCSSSIASNGKTRVKEAGPSITVSVVGFKGMPSAGDLLVVVHDEPETLQRVVNGEYNDIG